MYNRSLNLGKYSKKGSIPWNKGKHHKLESIVKMRIKKIGNINHLGYKHSQNTKEKIRVALKNNKNHLGKKHSEDTKQKIREFRLTQQIPKKFTSIEIKIKNILEKLRIPYQTHKSVMGITQPDFFIEPNICIYCDGDYWHNLPITRERDNKINNILKFAGYKVIRLTETQINKELNYCTNIICSLENVKN